MKNTHKSQSGFSAGHILLILGVVGILGVAGWRVYDSRKQTEQQPKPTQSNESSAPEETTVEVKDAEALKWKQVAARAGGFSIHIPDGWEVQNYEGNSIKAQKVAYQPGVAATVNEPGMAYAGDSIFRFNVTQFGPDDKFDFLDGDEQKQAFKLGDIEGTRYYKKYPVEAPQGLGPYPGMETYTYEFKKDGKTTYVAYNIFNDNEYIRRILSPATFSEGDKNQVELVERAVNTLQIH